MSVNGAAFRQVRVACETLTGVLGPILIYPSVCDVLEVEVVIPRVVRCNLFSHAAMHGWGLGFCRAEKHAVSVLTVIWSRSRGVSYGYTEKGVAEAEKNLYYLSWL
eukprot:scaffold11655_cov121-Isochrysis_galbana.AAC.1